MNLPSLSIRRPVLAMVMSISIVLLGLIGFSELGVREFPAVDPPVVSVTTNYPGAAAEVIESQITEPIERSVNAVAGIRTMSSISREGRSTIRVEFGLDIDIEDAANDVRDRVSQTLRSLPPDIDIPSVAKADADRQPIIFLGVRSDRRDLLELSDFVERVFQDPFGNIPGVSEAAIWGQKRYSMRIAIDQAKLGAYGVSISDVRRGLLRENVELPSGAIDGTTLELPVRTLSRLSEPEEFENILLRQEGDKRILLKDVARVYLGPQNERTILKIDGLPSVGVVLRPQPGSNHIAIVDEMHNRLDTILPTLPDDIELSFGFDTTQFIRASIREVGMTILWATILVVLIIFAFLRTWRATLIPAIVIPISLAGSFFILSLFGFSINVLTLLGMVLAIGLVVDDAIVVMENIYTKMEGGMARRQAGETGTREIFFAVVATTLALIAVFLPIMFLGGFSGRLLREFGVALAGAVITSSFIALSLTPMLSTRILRAGGSGGRLYRWSEPAYKALTRSYAFLLKGFLRVRWLAFIIILVAGGAIVHLYQQLPSELAPTEDRNAIRVNVRAQEGANFEYMDRVMDELGEIVFEEVPETLSVVTVTSPGFGAATAINSGFIRHTLIDSSERSRSQSEIAARLTELTSDYGGARVFISEEQSFSQGGGAGRSDLPVQYVLQAPTLDRLREELPGFLEAAENSEVFSRVDVDLQFTKPEIQINILRDRARDLNVTPEDIAETVNVALSEQRIGFFLMDGRQYDVMAQLTREDRMTIDALKQLKVLSSQGDQVRLDSVVDFSETVNPPQLLRFNRYVSATVSAAPAEGYTIGQGIEEMDRIAAELLPEDFRTDLAGIARELREGSESLQFVFILALVFVFLVLAAQFESFRDPIVILVTVPLALAGALGGMVLFGQTLNVFSQLGLIMLIGLVTKNGILIVEFANQRKARGMEKLEAVMGAAEARFRPVLMTSMSTILGILPLALATGAGSASRVSIGVAVIGGLMLGTILTLFVIPAIYCFVSSAKSTKESMQEEAPAAAATASAGPPM